MEFGGGWRSSVCQAIRTPPPVGDFGLVDFVTTVVGRSETRGGAHRAVNIDDSAADAADQMVMVVADAILEQSRRTGRLNAPDEPLGDQEAERVVDRLKRDGADLSPDNLRDRVRRDVRLTRHRTENSEPLSRHLNAALAKAAGSVSDHLNRLDHNLD
jgi:hypothetical protein